MSDLVEFLKARLDWDERVARAAAGAGDIGDGRWFDDGYEEVDDDSAYRIAYARDGHVRPHIARHDPARVLREVEAKRRIIGRYEKQASKQSENAMEEDRTWTLEPTLADLAEAYDSHPDYREEWRP